MPASWPTSQDETDKALELEDPKTITKQENWREVTCPTEIAFVLKLRNIKHFAQAATDGTPFTTPEMLHKFNWNATTKEAELVLEGEYEDNEIDKISRLLLDNMTRVTALNSIPAQVKISDLRKIFKTWTEATSTSVCGRHLGHYKCLFQTIDRQLPRKE